jgi:hypothetical protein
VCFLFAQGTKGYPKFLGGGTLEKLGVHQSFHKQKIMGDKKLGDVEVNQTPTPLEIKAMIPVSDSELESDSKLESDL